MRIQSAGPEKKMRSINPDDIVVPSLPSRIIDSFLRFRTAIISPNGCCRAELTAPSMQIVILTLVTIQIVPRGTLEEHVWLLKIEQSSTEAFHLGQSQIDASW